MWLAKLKLTIALVLALGVCGAGTAWTWPPAQDPAPAPPAAKTAPQEDAAKKARARSQEILRDALKEFNAANNDPAALPYRLLKDMAVLQARLGDRAAAIKMFGQARDLIEALPGESGRHSEWNRLAQSLARAGETDEALALVRRIPDGKLPNARLGGLEYRELMLQNIATALARERREKDALRVAGLLKAEEKKSLQRAAVLQEVALAHARAGDFAAALRVADRINRPAARVAALTGLVYFNLSYVEYPYEPGVALLQAEAGDKAQARQTLARAAELAAQVPEKEGKAQAWTALACTQARLGEIAAACKTAPGITHAEGKLIALAALARAQGRAGRVKDALAAVATLPSAAAKIHVLTHLGAGQAQAGDRKGARETFGRATALIGALEEGDRTLHLHNLASAQAVAGDYAGATETTGGSQDATVAKVNIVHARAEAGDFAGARQMAAQFTDSDWWRGKLWRGIAKEQARRGGEKAALEWIGRLDSPLARSNALLGVAEGLVQGKK
jgi:hypothetical protein